MSRKDRDERQAYKRVGEDSWEWGDKYNRYSAFFNNGHIYWTWEGEKDLGGGSEQSFEEFLSKGPRDTDAPADVVEGIRAAVLKMNSGMASSPPARSSSGGFAASRGPVKAAVNTSAQDPAAPLAALLGQGFLVFAVSAAIAVLLASVLPTLAKFVSIILPVLFGFFAAFRWGGMALILAGFFAMAGGFGSQFALERYQELASGTSVTLASIADAPRHPEATRFVVSDIRVARPFIGRTQRTVVQMIGAGPSPRTFSIQVMPLVPAGWTRDRPVPAWLACTTTPGFDCLQRSERDLSRTIRARDYDLDYYREAIADSRRRHGVTSANDAPILEGSGDPFDTPEFYLAGVVVLPLIAFALWAISVIGWRAWRKWKGAPAGSA